MYHSFSAYKCLGHTYEIGNFLVHSYYLVVEKNITVPKIGDIVASNMSAGFIETVVAVHKSNETGYLETKFQRCNENSQLNATRYIDVKIPFLRNKQTLKQNSSNEGIPSLLSLRTLRNTFSATISTFHGIK